VPRIRFTNLFAERIGGVNSVDVPAATVESALRALTDRHPSLMPARLEGRRAQSRHGAVPERPPARAAEIGTPVGPGDEIDIVSALEGG
jgi:hypothetical protein